MGVSDIDPAMWWAAGIAGTAWVLSGGPLPDPPTRDPKKRLKRQARRKLCYGAISTMEAEVYGGVWTDPRTGKVAPELRTDVTSYMCASWCSAHRW